MPQDLRFFTYQRIENNAKKKRSSKELLFSTQTRGRTGMDVTPLVFETSASTDSAIWANRFIFDCDAKVRIFFEPAIV